MPSSFPDFVSLNPDYPDQFHSSEFEGTPCVMVPHWAYGGISPDAIMIASYVAMLSKDDPMVSTDAVERLVGSRMGGFIFGTTVRGLIKAGILL